MAKYTRDEVEALLSKGIYKVTFKNKAGGLRTITCTRDFDWLRSEGIADEMDYADPKGGKCYNMNTIVWCIERQREGEKMQDVRAWRSFDAACVEEIEFFSPTRDEDIIVEEV